MRRFRGRSRASPPPDAAAVRASLFTIANDTVGTLFTRCDHTVLRFPRFRRAESTTAPAHDPRRPATASGQPEAGSGGPLGVVTVVDLARRRGVVRLAGVDQPRRGRKESSTSLTVRFLRSAGCSRSPSPISSLNAACVTAQISGKCESVARSPTSWNRLTDTTPGIAALARVIFVRADRLGCHAS